MGNINNWNIFLINENMKEAEKILRDLNIPDNNTDFRLIKDMLSKKPGFLGLFTKFHFEQDISLDDLKRTLDFLSSNNVSKLRNNPVSYRDYNTLIDEIDLIERDIKIKSIINQFNSEQKTIINNLPKDERENFDNLAYEIYHLKNEGFFKKISKAKTSDDILELMSDYVTKFKIGGTYESVLDIAEKDPNIIIVYKNDEDGIIITKIKDYNSIKKIGSTNWCIVNQRSSWYNYVISSTRNQYVIWNFEYEVGEALYMTGITVGTRDTIYAAHDYNDKDLSRLLPSFIRSLSEYLVGPTDDELTELERQKDEERRLRDEENARLERERIARYVAENIQRRENAEWEDDGHVQALVKFLKYEHDLDDFLGTNDDDIPEDEKLDIYDLIYEIGEHYGLRLFEFNNMEFAVGDDEECDKAAIENQKNLFDEFENLNVLFGNNYDWTDFVDGDDFAEAYCDDEDYYREDDNWRNYGIDESEDDEDEPDQDSLDSYIEDRKREAARDPKGYLEDMGYDDESIGNILKKFMKDGWEDDMAEDIIRIDGRGNSLSGYDNEEHEYKYDGTTYYIYRTN